MGWEKGATRQVYFLVKEDCLEEKKWIVEVNYHF